MKKKFKIKVIKYIYFVMFLGYVVNIFVVLFVCKFGKNNFLYDYLLFLYCFGVKLLMVMLIICCEFSFEFFYLYIGWIL